MSQGGQTATGNSQLRLRGSFCLHFILLLFLVCSFGTGRLAWGDELAERLKNEDLEQLIHLRQGSSRSFKTPFPIIRISVADPQIADIMMLSDREIYLTGNKIGVTNVMVWGRKRFISAKVSVEADVSQLKEKLFQVLPKEKIAVEAAGEAVVLSGEVSGPVAQETAYNLALSYVGGKKERVVNLMHIGGVQQVMVAVRVAEINRSVGKQIGINFVAATDKGFGATLLDKLVKVSPGFLPSPTISDKINFFIGGISGNLFWSAFFDLLKQEGLGRILAEPNLVTTSGQEASFLAGGEFPIPVPSGLGTVSIEYKKFGVGLSFTPTVLDQDKIAMRINPEVSELDFSSQTTVVVSGFIVPALRVRRTSTQVEMKDGQTLALAGLLADQHRNAIKKYPILGDLPVLGTLFRSSEFQKSETELVILVTPHLVKPQKAGAPRLPTDKYVEPNDLEFYLLGRMEGKMGQPKPPQAVPPPTNIPGFGHED